ncbi:MAG: hypothetical protein ACLFUU_01110 [Desulfobacteraceae bacterium]
MELYVPNDLLKAVSEVLSAENVNYEVSDKTFSLVLAGKKLAR